MSMLLYILIFFIGASIGSFLNVVISRSIEGQNWVGGRSHCDYCGKTLTWFDMIPVLSYLFYRGKSRCCRQSLSLQHPVVELMLGSLFLWWAAMGSLFFKLVSHPLSTLQPLFWLLMGIILLLIFATDLFYGLIPVLYVLLGSILTIIYRLVLTFAGAYQYRDLLLSLLSAAGAYAFFWFLRAITKGKGMGDGDVILAFMLGLLLSWPKVVPGIMAGFVIGALAGSCLILMGKKKLGSTLPFGPFMIAGTMAALIWGNSFLEMILK